MIFAADRKRERKWREMCRLQFSTGERLGGPTCRQNKSLQIGVPSGALAARYYDECFEAHHPFSKVTHILMTTANWIATLLKWDKYRDELCYLIYSALDKSCRA